MTVRTSMVVGPLHPALVETLTFKTLWYGSLVVSNMSQINNQDANKTNNFDFQIYFSNQNIIIGLQGNSYTSYSVACPNCYNGKAKKNDQTS